MLSDRPIGTIGKIEPVGPRPLAGLVHEEPVAALAAGAQIDQPKKKELQKMQLPDNHQRVLIEQLDQKKLQHSLKNIASDTSDHIHFSIVKKTAVHDVLLQKIVERILAST